MLCVYSERPGPVSPPAHLFWIPLAGAPLELASHFSFHYIVTCQVHPVLVKMFWCPSLWKSSPKARKQSSWRLPRRSSPPVNRPKDPWPRVLSLPGAQGGLLETPPRWHATIYMSFTQMVLSVIEVHRSCISWHIYIYYMQMKWSHRIDHNDFSISNQSQSWKLIWLDNYKL